MDEEGSPTTFAQYCADHLERNDKRQASVTYQGRSLCEKCFHFWVKESGSRDSGRSIEEVFGERK